MNKKTGPKVDWSQEQLDSALSHYANSSDGFRVTARKYNIPKTTLRRYWDKRKDSYLKDKGDRSEPDRSSPPDRSGPVRTGPDKVRTGPDQSNQGKVKADPGRTLGQHHAYKAIKNRREANLKLGVGVLLGLFINELCISRTGKSIITWLADKFRGETVQPSAQTPTYGYLERPQLKPEVKSGQTYGGYDLSEFK